MNDPRLERYLSALENALRPFPVGDRADIITEIRSHVLSALERDPAARLDSVLEALGEPETVANRYLLERGLQPTKPPVSPIVKWLVIGFLTTVAMILLFIVFLVSRISKYVDFDERGVKAFSGVIDVDAKHNRISIRGGSDREEFGGSLGVTDHIALIFEDGSVDISTASGSEMTWSCRGQGSTPNPKTVGETTTMDFSGVRDLRCDVGIPEKSHVEVTGGRGKIEFERPRFHVVAKLDSGKMEFSDAPGAAYKFTASVGAGKMDEFASSNQQDAWVTELHVGKGVLSHDKE
jgi:hypothetical protein